MHSEIIVVSGIPRSGTSLFMQMLAAGGVSVFEDQLRRPDEHNPLGYSECARVKDLADDNSWLGSCRGKAVKVVSGLLEHLPTSERYKVIFAQRSLDEVIASQETMLGRSASTEVDGFSELRTTLEAHLHHVKSVVLPRFDARVLYVSYRAALASPAGMAAQLGIFLGRELRLQEMAASVDESLYRQRQSLLARR